MDRTRMSSVRSRPTHRHGFTLIELLVVISIISLLIAILLPALSGARTAARSIHCLSQLRQWGIGLNTYMIDNDDYYIASYQATLGTTTTGKDFRWPQRMKGYVEPDVIHRCPAVASFDETDTVHNNDPTHVTARFNDLPLVTYTMNALNHKPNAITAGFVPPINVTDQNGSHAGFSTARGSDVRNTAAIWLTDGVAVTWSYQLRPSAGNFIPVLYERGARHSDGRNVNFLRVDGSAASGTPEEMVPGTYTDNFNIR